MPYSIPSTTILGVTKDALGYWIECIAPTAGMTLDTTASTYAIGCMVQNTADGKVYTNTGTVASPTWSLIQSSANADPLMIKTVEVALTAAQINALFTTSIEVVPAVAGKAIILDSFVFDLTGTATQFTAGGVVNLQYKNTANGAGAKLHADIAAATVTGATTRFIVQRVPLVAGFAITTADIIGQGVYIGVQTQNFATGTGTAICKVTYHLV